MLADIIPDFRRSTDSFVPAPPPETALLARFDDQLRTDRDSRDARYDCRDPRPDPQSVPRSDVRCDYRPDDRPASRPEFSSVARSVSRNDSRNDESRASRLDSRLDDSRDSRHTTAEDDTSWAYIKESTKAPQIAKRERQSSPTLLLSECLHS